jgi:hypothetical protein
VADAVVVVALIMLERRRGSLAVRARALSDKAIMEDEAIMTTSTKQSRPVVVAALGLRVLMERGLALVRAATALCHLSLELRRDTQAAALGWATSQTAALGSAAVEI